MSDDNTAVVASEDNLPPMLRQYLDYKAKHADALLLFQVGDFYETFFDDAVTISRALNLTLTSRDRNSPTPIPMAGVPIAVVDGYIERLVALGHSVAIVSQTEPPANGKGMFGRRLERIVTPGVRLLTGVDGGKGESLLAAVYLEGENDGAIAYANVQSGRISIREHISLRSLQQDLSVIAPVEVVLSRAGPLAKRLPLYPWAKGISIKLRAESASDVGSSGTRELGTIEGYGRLSPQAKRAVRLLLNYLDEATVGAAVSISEIRVTSEASAMGIDASTRANLELVRNLRDGGSDGTLLSVLDHTKTAAGARFLRNAILSPLVVLKEIEVRLATVRFLKTRIELRRQLFELLGYVSDIERITARIELKSVTPRELGGLRDSLAVLPRLREALAREIGQDADEASPLLHRYNQTLVIDGDLDILLARALVDVAPLSSVEGGLIRDGYHAEVDRLRVVKSSGRTWIAELEQKERLATGIGSLKIKYNNVIGFFFEVTKANLERVPAHFIRRQSMVGGERYTTTELQGREEELFSAESKLCAIERKLFEELRERLLLSAAELRKVSREIGELDFVLSLAEAADREDLVEPTVSMAQELNINAGRHPVLAKILQGGFIPNSLSMLAGEQQCLVITGPNMGGKSTFLRQAAIIVIMAQLGSFVPADSATIGIVDRIFARIGASDNMAEGESTFMVEMREASHIIANASARSLLLIDEIGRGTATADGVSLARAILEWLITEIKCRTLFATHYHELTVLESSFPSVGNLSVGSADVDGEVVFTHKIKVGPANKSYGLEVARLAGLPRNLIERARGYLVEFEATRENVAQSAGSSNQLSFFQAATVVREKVVEPADYRGLAEVKRSLLGIDVDDLTPRQALMLLGDLRAVVQRES